MARETNTLSNRYARSFHEVVVETASPEVALRQLHDVAALAEGEVGSFFANPTFDQEEKRAVLEKTLKNQGATPEVSRFLQILLDRGHIRLLPEIEKEFSEAERERRKEVHAQVRSAFPMDDAGQAKLISALAGATGKKVSIDLVLDKELIGGVVVKVGGVIYDASIQGYLTRLQEER